jgi:cytochrome bd-type quinol oxidase subunit 2
MLIPVALTLVAGGLFVASKRQQLLFRTKQAVFITVLSLIIFSLQLLVYPTVLGGSVQIDSVTTSGTMASAFTFITSVGADFSCDARFLCPCGNAFHQESYGV